MGAMPWHSTLLELKPDNRSIPAIAPRGAPSYRFRLGRSGAIN
jgi:hypothetical protein